MVRKCGKVIVLMPTRHVFGGPYVEALLSTLAHSYQEIELIHSGDEHIEELTTLACHLGARKVNSFCAVVGSRTFYENRLWTLWKVVNVFVKRFDRNAHYVGVGIRGGLVALIAYWCFKKEFTYYCLEIYNRANTNRMWYLVAPIQKYLCIRSNVLVIQSKERLKALESLMKCELSHKVAFQANAPRVCVRFTTRRTGDHAEHPRLIYSGATEARWAGGEYFQRLIECIGESNITVDNRVAKVHLSPWLYYEKLAGYDIGVAFYFAPDDINITSLGLSSGKINAYLHCGLPVIINAVAPYSALIQEFDCGLVMEQDTLEGCIREFVTRVTKERELFGARARQCAERIVAMDTY